MTSQTSAARPATDTKAGAKAGAAKPLIALVGNPNTGKTTLFNRLTGQNARVGNYPGITVDRRSGTMRMPKVWAGEGGATRLEVLDVPGTYSLSARSAEEQIAIQALLGLNGNARPDLAVIVLDASQLIRNLYMALQIVELGIPAVFALNMMDEVAADPPDHRALTHVLGVPCVPISARTGDGVPELKQAIATALQSAELHFVDVPYPSAVQQDAAAMVDALPVDWRAAAGVRAEIMGLWALTSIDADDELSGIAGPLRDATLARQRAAESAGRDIDAEIITARYAFLDAHHDAFYRPPPVRGLSDRLDRVLLHPVGGFAAFLLIMLMVFQALFSWADPMIGVVEDVVGVVGGAAADRLPAGLLTDLLVEGIIGGVGNVIVFLPQILLLFFFIGLLEDSGYMARAAYLMDRIMRGLGLHGRAFVPMLSGFACAVPAIMATRTMERKRDRLLTMMVVPLMTCSARLPVYTLLIAALFPPDAIFGVLPVQGLLMVGMYLFSVFVALAAAGILGRTMFKGKRVPLILELPPFRIPTLGSTVRLMWERSRLFLKEAGTVILVCTVLMWAMLTFPKQAEPAAGVDSLTAEQQVAWQASAMEHSYAGRLGKAIEPTIAPLGFDWKIGVGIIGAFAAREVFVSTMGIVYGVGADVDEESESLRDQLKAEAYANGAPVYTPLVGLSLMVFFALASQCMSTLAVVKRETRGYKWPVFLFTYMTGLAWVASFLVYQGGRLLGFAG